MVNDKCTHLKPNGESAIVWDIKHLELVYPPKVNGVCPICHQSFKITKDEYEHLIKGGEV